MLVVTVTSLIHLTATLLHVHLLVEAPIVALHLVMVVSHHIMEEVEDVEVEAHHIMVVGLLYHHLWSSLP